MVPTAAPKDSCNYERRSVNRDCEWLLKREVRMDFELSPPASVELLVTFWSCTCWFLISIVSHIGRRWTCLWVVYRLGLVTGYLLLTKTICLYYLCTRFHVLLFATPHLMHEIYFHEDSFQPQQIRNLWP